MTTLIEAVERAVTRLAIDGLTGWGINQPDGWDSVVVGPVRGCESETCGHVSHDPAAASYRVFPRRGQLLVLGRGDEGNWFAVQDGADTTFWRTTSPQHYHDRVHQRPVEDVPEYLLAALAPPARAEEG